MKMKLMRIAYLLLVVLFVASCSKKSDVPVPTDASFVIHIDGASLNSKLSWEEVKQSEWYKLANEHNKDSLTKIMLNDPEASGIDVKSDMYVFVRMVGNGAYTAVVGNVKDEKAFEAFMGKTMEGATSAKDGDISVLKKNEMALTWKGKRFVMVMNSDMAAPSAMAMREGNYDDEKRGISPDSLVKFATEVHTMKGDNSIGTDSRFSEMLKENGDVHFWINGSNMYKGALPAALALTKAELLFKGNATAATLNFENGKIDIDAKSYYNKDLAALYKKYSMKDLDESMLKMIPSQNVAAVFAMNYPPEGLKAFVSLLGLDGLINVFLNKEGFSLDEFIKANKGDILLSVSDFGVKSSSPYMMDSTAGPRYSGPDAKILFATSVNDKAAFQKMIDLFRNQLEKGGAGEMMMMGHIPYQLKDNWFIAGNDSATVFSFGTTSAEQPFISKFRGHPVGGFVDIQKFINGAKPMFEHDSSATNMANESLKTWQDIVFYGGEFKNDATVTHMEVNMVDKNTNSLKQLNSYLGVMAKIADAQEKKRKSEWDKYSMPDSTVVVPRPVVPPSN